MHEHGIEQIARLTPAQEGIVFHTLEAGARRVYVEQYAALLEGDVEPGRLYEAWRALEQGRQLEL